MLLAEAHGPIWTTDEKEPHPSRRTSATLWLRRPDQLKNTFMSAFLNAGELVQSYCISTRTKCRAILGGMLTHRLGLSEGGQSVCS